MYQTPSGSAPPAAAWLAGPHPSRAPRLAPGPVGPRLDELAQGVPCATPETLGHVLRQAARAANWNASVRRRCAWCGHLADAAGREVEPSPGVPAITTDGMCLPCARSALARLAQRRARP